MEEEGEEGKEDEEDEEEEEEEEEEEGVLCGIEFQQGATED